MAASLDEFQRIARFFAPLAKDFPGALDLKDDAALITPPVGHDLIVTTDAMVEGTHFQHTDSPASIAQRLLRSNLSDLAAKGATPLAYTLVVTLNDSVDDAWLAAFSAALADDQRRYGIHLAGGDSLSTKGPLHFTVAAYGITPVGAFIARKTAPEASYAVYVSGTIGDSHLGLRYLLGDDFGLSADQCAYLIDRHYAPTPRLELGQGLRGLAKACVDVSDGLVADLGHIARLSGLNVTLHAEQIPLSPAARAALDKKSVIFSDLITGGEDYELCFFVAEADAPRVAILGRDLNLPLTQIGVAVAGISGVRVLDAAKNIISIPRAGWMHF